jgi:prepilin peptidase CpaA
MTLQAIPANVAMVVFAFSMVYAAIGDLTTLRIRNGLVLLVGGAFFALAPATGFGLADIAWNVAAAAIVLAVGFAFFAFGWIGGGDAKFAAATALWLGPDLVPAYIASSALLGGTLTLAVLQLRNVALPAGLGSLPWVATLQSAKSGVPYGVALGAAALLLFPHTRWMAPAF